MAKALVERKPTTAESLLLGIARNNALRGSAVWLADRAIWEVLKRSNNPPGVKRDDWEAPGQRGVQAKVRGLSTRIPRHQPHPGL